MSGDLEPPRGPSTSPAPATFTKRWSKWASGLFKREKPLGSEHWFNPEADTEQKRLWLEQKAQEVKAASWPEHIYENFFVLGLPPDMEVTQVAEQLCDLERKQRHHHDSDSDSDHGKEHMQPPQPSFAPQVLFRYPAGSSAPISDDEVAALAFPAGVAPEKLKRTPSLSALDELIMGRDSDAQQQCFVFMLKVAGNFPLYGCCWYVREMLHRPPYLARQQYRSCRAPFRQCLIAAPRCYCLLSRYPFFELHFRVLKIVLDLERLERLLEFDSEKSKLPPPASLGVPMLSLPARTGRRNSHTPDVPLLSPSGAAAGTAAGIGASGGSRARSSSSSSHGAVGAGVGSGHEQGGSVGAGAVPGGSGGDGQQHVLPAVHNKQAYCAECAGIIEDMCPFTPGASPVPGAPVHQQLRQRGSSGQQQQQQGSSGQQQQQQGSFGQQQQQHILQMQGVAVGHCEVCGRMLGGLEADQGLAAGAHSRFSSSQVSADGTAAVAAAVSSTRLSNSSAVVEAVAGAISTPLGLQESLSKGRPAASASAKGPTAGPLETGVLLQQPEQQQQQIGSAAGAAAAASGFAAAKAWAAAAGTGDAAACGTPGLEFDAIAAAVSGFDSAAAAAAAASRPAGVGDERWANWQNVVAAIRGVSSGPVLMNEDSGSVEQGIPAATSDPAPQQQETSMVQRMWEAWAPKTPSTNGAPEGSAPRTSGGLASFLRRSSRTSLTLTAQPEHQAQQPQQQPQQQQQQPQQQQEQEQSQQQHEQSQQQEQQQQEQSQQQQQLDQHGVGPLSAGAADANGQQQQGQQVVQQKQQQQVLLQQQQEPMQEQQQETQQQQQQQTQQELAPLGPELQQEEQMNGAAASSSSSDDTAVIAHADGAQAVGSSTSAAAHPAAAAVAAIAGGDDTLRSLRDVSPCSSTTGQHADASASGGSAAGAAASAAGAAGAAHSHTQSNASSFHSAVEQLEPDAGLATTTASGAGASTDGSEEAQQQQQQQTSGQDDQSAQQQQQQVEQMNGHLALEHAEDNQQQQLQQQDVQSQQAASQQQQFPAAVLRRSSGSSDSSGSAASASHRLVSAFAAIAAAASPFSGAPSPGSQSAPGTAANGHDGPAPAAGPAVVAQRAASAGAATGTASGALVVSLSSGDVRRSSSCGMVDAVAGSPTGSAGTSLAGPLLVPGSPQQIERSRTPQNVTIGGVIPSANGQLDQQQQQQGLMHSSSSNRGSSGKRSALFEEVALRRSGDMSAELCKTISHLVQADSCAVLAAYRNSPVPLPGETYRLMLGDLYRLEFERTLPLEFVQSYAPSGVSKLQHDALSYSEVECAQHLQLWTVAALCRSLSLENIITLLTAVLLEKQLVVFCPHIGTLAAVVLSLVPLLRPFAWHSLMLPVTPNNMLAFLEAPVPFVLGVQYKTPCVANKCHGLMRVNVYKDAIKNASFPSLPNSRQLLQSLAPHHATLCEAAPLAVERPVHVITPDEEEAARSFLAVTHDYLSRMCGDLRLHTIVNVGMSKRTGVFMKDSLLESQAAKDRPFMKAFLETQMFAAYADEVTEQICWG